jgi:hypothetical protein
VLLMEVSAARGRFAVLGAVVLSAMMFTWVAIVNGYPLVFNDSSRYLDGAIRRYIPSESPIFYGVFMIPFHLDGVSLWPVVGAQGLILAYVIRATLRIFGFVEERTFLLVSAFLAVFTAAPWFTSLIMPDFFTPICVLAMFALFRGWEGFVPLERLFLIGLALVALTSHVTHIIIGLALATLFAALRLFGRPSHRTALLVVLALPLVAFGAVVGINLIAKGRPVITRDGPVFLLARSFADGPAYEYMRDHCGERKWHVCAAYRTLPRDAQDFLWSPAGSVWSVGSHDEVRTEASDIVYGAIKEHPGETLLAALGNGFAQLVTYRAGVDFGSWPDTNGGSAIAAVIHRFFPREVGHYKDSLQQQGRLDATAVNYVYSITVVLSIIGTLALVLRTRVDAGLAEFLLVVAVALVVNAGATGGLSMVSERYQARIVWLVPLAFAISLLVYQRQRDVRMALRADSSLEGSA